MTKRLRTGEDFPVVYEREKPQQITDTAALEKIIDEMIAANPKQVEQYRAGKTTIIGFFVGQVMKASKGQAKPELVNEMLKKLPSNWQLATSKIFTALITRFFAISATNILFKSAC